MDYADSIDHYMKCIKRYPILDSDELLGLIEAYQESGDPDYLERVINSNLRFVVKIAHEYRFYKHVSMTDLIQEGNMGMIRAAGKFDTTREVKFISYAVWWIRAEMQKHIISSWSLVKLGTTGLQRKMFFGLRKMIAKLEKERDCGNLDDISFEELAEAFEAKVEDVAEIATRVLHHDHSLDQRLNPSKTWDTKTTSLELKSDGESLAENIERHNIIEVVRDEVLSLIPQLEDREASILTDRLLCDNERTLAELGADYGVSRERMRQIEVKLKSRLREVLLKKDPCLSPLH
jgi:RNA polymerase sigma-32 factor